MTISKKQIASLISEAAKAASKAYCPYSDYRVGAAVLGSDNKIYSGCNVENASYGLTVCAERTAIFNAVCSGVSALKAIAIAGPPGSDTYPCGACRQVIAEFCEKSMPIYITTTDNLNKYQTLSISQLLPYIFKLRKKRRGGTKKR